jgi:hypothetical protein
MMPVEDGLRLIQADYQLIYLKEIEQAASAYLLDMTSDNAQALQSSLDIYHTFMKGVKL